jgi:2,3-bisphosphoglycerate-independent phosphoglycerate mutase
MVGHTGNFDATIMGVESVDLALARIIKVCDEYNVTLLITADHGNADEMLEKNKKGELQVRTAHSLNPVPFIIYDKKNTFTIKEGNYGLANVAPTVATILNLKPYDCWEKSMI